LKVQLQIGLSETDLATDVVEAFSGWVDPLSIQFNEIDDTLTLTAYSADELANRMTAEGLVTRYINSNVDGSGNPGLFLMKISGLYATDANITSYVLKPGVHTVTFDGSGTPAKAKLDDGEYVDLSVGPDFILENKDNTEQLKVRVNGTLSVDANLQQSVIVINAGDTLPYTWYSSIWIKRFLSQAFTQIGLTSQVFDTTQIASYDGNAYLSFLDIPPGDDASMGEVQASACMSDNTIFVAVGSKVYQRAYTSDVYTLLGDMGATVDRLFADETNHWLWIVYTGAHEKVKVWDLVGLSLSAECDTGQFANVNTIDVLPSNRCLVYISNTIQTVYQLKFDGLNFTQKAIYAKAALTPAFDSLGTWGRVKRGGSEHYFFNGESGGTKYIHYISCGSGVWSDGGNLHAYTDEFTYGLWSDGEGKVYYWDSPNKRVKSVTSSAEAVVATLSVDDVIDMFYSPDRGTGYFCSNGSLYSISGGAATAIVSSGMYSNGTNLMANATVIFGITTGRRLWQYGTILAQYISEPDCTGITIKAALNKACQAFNLMFYVSSIKAAYVYRRGNDSGTPQTSGNNLTVNADIASNLSKENLYGKAFDLISIDNSVEKHTYDGSSGPVVFDKGVFGDKRTLTISNDWIPTELIKHLLFWMWQFFKTDRSLIRIPLGIVPLFQYEIMDQCTASFSTSKIGTTGSGPIMGQTLYQNGSMDLEVLT
jgi:hypothetical protein